MPDITLPAHNWKPLPAQQPAWNYLQNGGKHAELIWHRRFGKDEISMQHAAIAMTERPGTYWHMLPMANQVKKAIWNAVNPRTGRRRIDDVFPDELFQKNESEMLVKSKFNASTWQCLGSDNFQGSIGSPPVGIVYSEWALANPSVRGFLRPIITENQGWQIFITTPRGKNHAYRTYNAARQNPKAFAQLLTVHDTRALTPDQLIEELHEYVNTYGEDQGIALYEQEYECSFEAAVLGSFYTSECKRLESEGRLCSVPHDPSYPVHVAMDIGRSDDTSIWWFQMVEGEVRIIDFYTASGKDPDAICSQLLGKIVHINLIQGRIEVEYGESIPSVSKRTAYDYGFIYLPHDGAAKTFAAKGKSVEEQFASVFGWGKIRIIPRLSVQDGIQASRYLLNICYMDYCCEDGYECLKQYRREWDDKMLKFKDKPLHDYASNPADGFRYVAIAWKEGRVSEKEAPIKWEMDRTFNDMVNKVKKRRLRDD